MKDVLWEFEFGVFMTGKRLRIAETFAKFLFV